MGTKLWGPDTWYVIHVIADSSPDLLNDNEQLAYRRFYEGLADVLPCPSCSVHYKTFLKSNPPTFKTRHEMLKWTIRAHNHANQQTGANILTEEDAMKKIESEIHAREIGSVRGRLPTLFEKCFDMATPVVITTIILLFMLYMFKSITKSS